jgi:hypothetical protein
LGATTNTSDDCSTFRGGTRRLTIGTPPALKGHLLERLAGDEYGHDLKKLLAAAVQQGLIDFVALEERQLIEIQRASKYYYEKVFEYPALGEAMLAYPHNPDIETLLGAAKAMVVALEVPCRDAK